MRSVSFGCRRLLVTRTLSVDVRLRVSFRFGGSWTSLNLFPSSRCRFSLVSVSVRSDVRHPWPFVLAFVRYVRSLFYLDCHLMSNARMPVVVLPCALYVRFASALCSESSVLRYCSYVCNELQPLLTYKTVKVSCRSNKYSVGIGLK